MATRDQGNRAGNGRFTRTPDTAARDAAAVRLRAQGASVEEIAATLGYANKGTASKAVQRALQAVVRPDVEQLRALQGDELDAIQQECWRIISTPHPKVSASGRIVVDPSTGEPVTDPAPIVAALNTLVRVGERRAKLLGLDGPAKVEIKQMPTLAELRGYVEQMRDEVNLQRARQGLPPQEFTGPPPGHPERIPDDAEPW